MAETNGTIELELTPGEQDVVEAILEDALECDCGKKSCLEEQGVVRDILAKLKADDA